MLTSAFHFHQANWFMNDEEVRPIIVLISQIISER